VTKFFLPSALEGLRRGVMSLVPLCGSSVGQGTRRFNGGDHNRTGKKMEGIVGEEKRGGK
jgi:hypothetical protein